MKFRAGVCVLVVAAGVCPAMAEDGYVTTVLVASDASYNPQIVDPNMIDAWGIALRPPGAGGHIWVDNTRSGTSVEYIGDVMQNGVYMPIHQDGLKSVTVDAPAFTDKGYASVTGLAYNAASDLAGQAVEFPVAGPAVDNSTMPPTPIAGGTSGAAKFVFVTKDGTINAWRSNTAVSMTSAPIVIDYSKTGTLPAGDFANPVYTGVAITTKPVPAANQGNPAAGNHLFVADFRNNVVNVFDNQWHDVTGSHPFVTPATVEDLHPFNVQDIGGHLYVAYSRFDPNSDEGFEDIPGFGRLVEYNEDGTLVRDFNSGPVSADEGGHLNSPWGVAIAPATFGKFGGDVLVANFGDGTIAAFDPATGDFLDYLRDANGEVLAIDGLWGLTFGNGFSLGDANSLYFTAGPDLEQAGMFGRVTVAVPEPASLSVLVAGGMMLLARRRVLRSA